MIKGGSLVLALFVGGAFAWNAVGEDAASEVPPPASTQMAVVMMRAGLDAEVLSAAGVSAADAATAIADAIVEHDTSPTALATADADYAAAKPTADALERKIRSGLASASDVTSYQTAKTSTASAKSARESILASICAAGCTNLTPAQAQTIATIEANGSWKLPVQYLTVNRTEPDWVALRDHLDARRIYQDEGDPVPQAVTDYLATIEGDATVSAATANLASFLPSVQAAWNQAVSY